MGNAKQSSGGSGYKVGKIRRVPVLSARRGLEDGGSERGPTNDVRSCSKNGRDDKCEVGTSSLQL